MDWIFQLVAYLKAWFNRPINQPENPIILPPVTPTPMPITPAPAPTPAPLPTPVATVPPAPIPAPVPSSPLLFDTPQNARHSVRVMCDNAGLSIVPNVLIHGREYLAKDVICACIEVESQFYNYLPSGNPTKHQNIVGGKVSSTDWGICQINDYYHIGKGKDFPSVDYVMANPDKAVQFMIDCYKAGELKLWVSYSSGQYLANLPQNAKLAGR